MHLISSLASGIVGAANGSCTLVARGTTTPVTYYQDFEASQAIQSTLDGIPLDANGGLVVYVNQLVDVRVLDVNGALLREFVAGDEAPAVEVISQSFTGTSYRDGSSGTSKPTTLQRVLDAWFTSAGQADFNVTVGGASSTLRAAVAGLSGLFYNVKSYGAVGDGVADDSAAIQSAITAAAASAGSGGIVFYPPGLYRSTAVITLPSGTSMMGAGGVSSKIQWDNAVLAEGLLVSASKGGVTNITGLWFGSVNTNFTAPLVQQNAPVPCVFEGCLFGGDSTTKGISIVHAATIDAQSETVIQRCEFQVGGDVQAITQNGTGRLIIRDSMISLPAASYSHAALDLLGNFVVDGCQFDPSLVTAGAPIYVQFAPTATSYSATITNNRFNGGGAGAIPIALKNTLATPIFDCWESGNMFGNNVTSVTPYAYTTDGYAAIGSMSAAMRAHMTRVGRVAEYFTNVNQQIDAKQYGTICIKRSTNAAGQNISATKGSIGDRLVVALMNESGGNALITFSAPDFSLNGATAALTVNTSTRTYVEFEWLAVQPEGTNGQWVQIAAASTGVV